MDITDPISPTNLITNPANAWFPGNIFHQDTQQTQTVAHPTGDTDVGWGADIGLCVALLLVGAIGWWFLRWVSKP